MSWLNGLALPMYNSNNAPTQHQPLPPTTLQASKPVGTQAANTIQSNPPSTVQAAAPLQANKPAEVHTAAPANADGADTTGNQNINSSRENSIGTDKPKYMWRCRYGCNQLYAHSASLRAHMISVHNLPAPGEVIDICQICDQKLDRQLKKRHIGKFCFHDAQKAERKNWNVPQPVTKQELADTFGLAKYGEPSAWIKFEVKGKGKDIVAVDAKKSSVPEYAGLLHPQPFPIAAPSINSAATTISAASASNGSNADIAIGVGPAPMQATMPMQIVVGGPIVNVPVMPAQTIPAGPGNTARPELKTTTRKWLKQNMPMTFTGRNNLPVARIGAITARREKKVAHRKAAANQTSASPTGSGATQDEPIDVDIDSQNPATSDETTSNPVQTGSPSSGNITTQNTPLLDSASASSPSTLNTNSINTPRGGDTAADPIVVEDEDDDSDSDYDYEDEDGPPYNPANDLFLEDFYDTTVIAANNPDAAVLGSTNDHNFGATPVAANGSPALPSVQNFGGSVNMTGHFDFTIPDADAIVQSIEPPDHARAAPPATTPMDYYVDQFIQDNEQILDGFFSADDSENLDTLFLEDNNRNLDHEMQMDMGPVNPAGRVYSGFAPARATGNVDSDVPMGSAPGGNADPFFGALAPQDPYRDGSLGLFNSF